MRFGSPAFVSILTLISLLIDKAEPLLVSPLAKLKARTSSFHHPRRRITEFTLTYKLSCSSRFNRRTIENFAENCLYNSQENGTCAEGRSDRLNSDLDSKAIIVTNITAQNNKAKRLIAAANDTTRKKSSRVQSHKKWRPDNFERDYQLLQTALARDSSSSDLQQLQRRYTLDYGFAKRPLFKDVFNAIFNLGAWTALIIICRQAGIRGFAVWSYSVPWWRKACFLFTEGVLLMNSLHYWFVVMTLPLVYLMWAKSSEKNNKEKNCCDRQQTPSNWHFMRKWTSDFGSRALILDAYFEERQHDSRPSTSGKTAKIKDTVKDHVLCLLENWTSAILASFIWRVLSLGSSLVGRSRSQPPYFISRSFSIATNPDLLPTLSRLITRVGAAAALHQYPSLLFELRRNDQPRPLCRPTFLMQRAVDSLFRWMYVGTSADFALLLGSTFHIRRIESASSFGMALTGFFLSIIGPVCHILALMKLIHLSKCRAISLSHATSFPNVNYFSSGESGRTIENPSLKKWRYQIRWRTTHRISQTLRNWIIFLLTNHKPLIMEMDEWNNAVCNNGFSTEGYQFKDNRNEHDELVIKKDEILESLSLIFRDRNAAISNATQARFTKHQESYNSKESDDVLGVAIQQTFGIGLSYIFDHFDSPPNNEQVSIHQLRARMAKSAIRLKNSLDNALRDELSLMQRLKENVSTEKNHEIAKQEMELAEHEIRERHKSKIDRIKTALLTMIPTNAVSPEGSEKFGSPIMIAEYVNITASVDRRDLTASTLESPDSLAVYEEYIRKDFGGKAAEAFREREIAYRMKETNMLNEFRQRHGKLKEYDKDLTIDSSEDGLLLTSENE